MDLPKGTSGRSALDVAQEAALTAGRILLEKLPGEKSITHKGRNNLVTDIDLLVEKRIISLLQKEFPSFGILGEETAGVRADEGFVWIIDPLDGTRNYTYGSPFFSIVIALAYNGDVQLGINYDPNRQEMFLAQKGRGASLNGKPITLSHKSSIEQCLLGFDIGYDDEGSFNTLKVVHYLWPRMQTVRVLGSAALGLSYAASGRIDLYFHHHLEPWDIAAGLLLIKEAGGIITDRHGNPASLYGDGVIASNATIHAEFLRLTEGLAWRK